MTVTPAELTQALDIARSIYHEAMGRAGMLKGKVTEVHMHAEAIRTELDQEDDAEAS